MKGADLTQPEDTILCAYADNRPITDPSGRPFRSTSYTVAEARCA